MHVFKFESPIITSSCSKVDLHCILVIIYFQLIFVRPKMYAEPQFFNHTLSQLDKNIKTKMSAEECSVMPLKTAVSKLLTITKIKNLMPV